MWEQKYRKWKLHDNCRGLRSRWEVEEASKKGATFLEALRKYQGFCFLCGLHTRQCSGLVMVYTLFIIGRVSGDYMDFQRSNKQLSVKYKTSNTTCCFTTSLTPIQGFLVLNVSNGTHIHFSDFSTTPSICLTGIHIGFSLTFSFKCL